MNKKNNKGKGGGGGGLQIHQRSYNIYFIAILIEYGIPLKRI